MTYPQDHWKDGECDCPKDGVCIHCGAPCTDHDLIADWHVCGPCINKSFDEYEKENEDGE